MRPDVRRKILNELLDKNEGTNASEDGSGGRRACCVTPNLRFYPEGTQEKKCEDNRCGKERKYHQI